MKGVPPHRIKGRERGIREVETKTESRRLSFDKSFCNSQSSGQLCAFLFLIQVSNKTKQHSTSMKTYFTTKKVRSSERANIALFTVINGT